MSGTLSNGTAVVTGAGSAIGRAIAIAFARDGSSNLAIGDLNSTEVQETSRLVKEQFPTVNVLAESIDVSDEASAARFFQLVIEKFGRIDFAVNIADHEPPAVGVHEAEEADFDLAFTKNQKGIFFCEKPILGHMIKQQPLEGHETRGSIVNVASIASTTALPGLSVYSSTMGGVFGLSKSDAYDYARDRIRVNVVAPLIFSKKALYETLEEHPFKRYATPEDVADAVVFLSGPRAAFISGISLPVDGGFHLKTGGPPR